MPQIVYLALGMMAVKNEREINLWSLDINEIVLYHTDYNRSIKVLGNKLTEKLQNEEEIYNDIHKNYYEGLDSFCKQWDKWMPIEYITNQDKPDSIEKVYKITNKLV